MMMIRLFVVMCVCGLTCSVTSVHGQTKSSQKASSQVDAVYIGVVDCALPPVAFSSMAGAFKEEAILRSFDSMVTGEAGKKVLQSTFARVKEQCKPEQDLKARLARYFASKFTVEEAKTITASCAEGVGFTDRALLDRFQSALNTIPDEAHKQSVLVTCTFMGSLMLALAEDLQTLTPDEMGINKQ